MLTVEQLRNFLAGLPGDAPVRVEFGTDHDGKAVTRRGPASSVMLGGGELVIAASDLGRGVRDQVARSETK